MDIKTEFGFLDYTTDSKKTDFLSVINTKMKSIMKIIAPYVMIFPAMIVSVIFMIYPIFYMLYLSFFKWNMIGEKKFIGIKNYISMFSDSDFIGILGNTVQFTLFTVVGFITFGMLIALFLKENNAINNMIQTIIFMPYVVPMISIAFIWMWMMDSDLGLLNYVLGLFKIDAVAWLENPKVALYSLIIVNIWKAAGYYALIILSALHNIPTYIYEAAELDRANKISTFFKITLPMLSPTLFFLVLTGTIASFKVFETINVMTQGGPDNATNTLVYYIYQNGFSFYKIGYASAVGVFLMIIVALLTIVYFAVLQKKVHYQ